MTPRPWLRTLGQAAAAVSADVATPAISASDDETGSSVTVTVSGAGGTDTIQLLYRLSTSVAWTLGNTRVGDGDIAVTGLTDEALYEFLAYASQGGVYSGPSNVAQIRVTDGAEPFVPDTTATRTGRDRAIEIRLRRDGEAAVYKRSGATVRAVTVILKRQPRQRALDDSGTERPAVTATLANRTEARDLTADPPTYGGIHTSEIDRGLGVDTLTLASQAGDEPEDLSILQVLWSNDSALMVALA